MDFIANEKKVTSCANPAPKFLLRCGLKRGEDDTLSQVRASRRERLDAPRFPPVVLSAACHEHADVGDFPLDFLEPLLEQQITRDQYQGGQSCVQVLAYDGKGSNGLSTARGVLEDPA